MRKYARSGSLVLPIEICYPAHRSGEDFTSWPQSDKKRGGEIYWQRKQPRVAAVTKRTDALARARAPTFAAAWRHALATMMAPGVKNAPMPGKSAASK